nr:hypothetical protein [Tanacetum cinerariifolium]
PAFTIQLSLSKPEQDLSYINRPTPPIIEDCVSNSKNESETKASQIVPSFVQSTEQVTSPRHFVKRSITAATSKPASLKSASSGKRRNIKACFVCKSLDHLIKDYDYHVKKMAQPTPRNHAHRGNPKHYAQMTHHNPQKHMDPATGPRHANPIVTKTKSPIRRHITCSPSPKTSNSPSKVTAVTAPVVSAAQGKQGKWEWGKKCLILDHVSCNKSASMTLKMFDYNDALRRSKSVMAWVPKRI